MKTDGFDEIQHMLEMEWNYAEMPEPEKVKALCSDLGIKEDFAAMLINRGIETFDDAKSFFRPSLDDLHDPFLMKGMEGVADTNQDNKITALELHEYVKENVWQQSSNKQLPELQGDENRVLVQFQ